MVRSPGSVSRGRVSGVAEARALLLVGDEVCLRDEVIRSVERELFPDPSLRDLNSHSYSAISHALSHVFTQAETAPFLAKRRLVIVKDIERFNKENQRALVLYLQKTQRQVLWLFVSGESKISGSAFLSSLAKISRVVSCQAPFKESEVKDWIRSRCLRSGKQIDEEAVDVLWQRVGRNLTELASRIEELALFSGERGRLRAEDVEALIGESADRNAFYLYDALHHRRFSPAYRTLRRLEEQGSRPHEILGGLIWRFDRDVRVKNLLEQGLDASAISRRLGISGYYVDREINAARRVNARKADAKMRVLRGADTLMKRGGIPPRLALERCLLGLYEAESA